MSRPVLGRAASATLTAMTFAAVTATAAGTAVASTPAHTSLSIRSAKATIAPGGHDTISGVLLSSGHAVSGVEVVLDARPAGASSFTPAAHATTGSRGRVAFVVSPAKRTAYKLVFSGTPAFAASRSGIVTVNVSSDRRMATSLSIRAVPASINPGSSAVVSGVLLGHGSPLANHRVVLRSKPAGATTWHAEASKRTGPHGFVAFVVHPTTKTRYQLAFLGNAWQRPSQSGVVTVNVRIPATLTSAVAADSIEPGGSDTVSGVLSSAAGPIAGRTIALLAKPAGTTTWHQVATGTTASDGSVAFSVSPATTTKYVLVHRAGYFYTYARSPAVTVNVRKPTSLSIRLAGGTVSGTLQGAQGGALAGRTVTLLSRPAGTTDAFTVVSSSTTSDKGYVSFAVAPASSTDYELSYDGESAFDPCHSGVVTFTAP